MTAICPNSTPTLKDIRLVTNSSSGIPISDGEINLHIPAEKCCVYENEKLI